MNDSTPNKPWGDATETYADNDSRRVIGEKIGPYRLLDVIGEGGMGTVYLAEQVTPVRRRVALKIIKKGMDSRQVLARFEAERQALSLMDHPNIARAFDAGTTEAGQPYFVMEAIQGQPITQYCDDKRLSLADRLTLMISVCSAVQHAHQKGIIHRDLKPSNILVTEYDAQAVAKVIDFGLAKALHQPLTDKTMHTQVGQVVGTLEYLSPEQSSLNQLDVDSRTDVYSLGVLLYELLTGSLPFDRERLRTAAWDKVLTIIREEEPPRPSVKVSHSSSSVELADKRRTDTRRLGSAIRGDLDWIVMKAMAKDRDERYESANGLGMELQRYLAGDAVIAAPPSASYRVRKFVKRHRTAVITSGLIASALILGLVGTSWGLAWALIEKGEADHQAEIAEQTRAEARYSQYVSNVRAASTFLLDGDTLLARKLLQGAPAEYRDFEWAMLARQAWKPKVAPPQKGDESLATYWANGTPEVEMTIYPTQSAGGVFGGFFAPNGDVFLNLANGDIKRYDIWTGNVGSVYAGTAGSPHAVALTDDGKKLGAFTFSSRATVWDVESGRVEAERLESIDDAGSPWNTAWSPNHDYLISTHMDGTVRIWDARRLALLEECKGHTANAFHVHVSPESDSLMTSSTDGTIRRWSCPEGESLATYQVPIEGKVESQAISPTGKYAATSFRDGTHLVWDIENEAEVFKIANTLPSPYSGMPRVACAFSDDESLCAMIAGANQIAVYATSSGEVLKQIPVEANLVHTIAFSRDGSKLLAISNDGEATVLHSRIANEVQLTKAHTDMVYQLDRDDAGDMLLLGSYDKTASTWNLRTRQRQSVYDRHEAEIVAVDLSADGSRAATLDANGELHVWSTAEGKELFVIAPKSDDFAKKIGRSGGGLRGQILNYSAVLSTGIFSPDGTRLVAFHQDSMRVFDSRTRDEVTKLEGATSVGWAVFNHDSSLVAILENNRRVAGVWNLSSGKRVARLDRQREHLAMIDFSPVDNTVATCCMDATIILYDATTGKQLRPLEAKSGVTSCCRFSRDGRHILAGYADGTARVWDVSSGKLLSTLIGHSMGVRDVRLSPDQRRVLTCGVDDRAIIWDRTEPLANQLAVVSGQGKLLQAHWDEHGREIVTAWSNGSVKIIPGAKPDEIARLEAEVSDFEAAINGWIREVDAGEK